MAVKLQDTVGDSKNIGELNSGTIVKVLMGGMNSADYFYFPPSLIGGCCPRIPGQEAETVWHAAADATDSERVQVVWQASGNKVWYLAVKSADMASNTRTWCPFASLLPDMRDASPPPVCYTYYSDETAVMMTVSAESLQIHRGTAAVLRAKSERVARELGGANVIDLVPDNIINMQPVLWQSLSLFEDRARRILSTFAVLTAMVVILTALLIWFFSSIAAVTTRHDLEATRVIAAQKSQQLLNMIQDLRASPSRGQLASLADLNENLLKVNGMLEIYQIKEGKVLWRAVLPANVTSERINEMGAQLLDTTPRGVIIGNSPEALVMGKKQQ